MRRRVLSFALNHKGMGHASRLVAVHLALRERGVDTLFFVGHRHRMIDDYGFDQITIPEHSPSDPATIQDRNTLVTRAVMGQIIRPDDILLHDVAIHPDLYGIGADLGCIQGYIYRDRKDKADPVEVLHDRAPTIDNVYRLGHPGFTEVREGVRILGVSNVMRPPLGRKSVWSRSAGRVKIVVAAGGGGHDDAEEFINAAIRAVDALCVTQNLQASLIVIPGPFYKGSVEVRDHSSMPVRIVSYLGPQYSLYEETDIMISQGGYNTVEELKASGVKAVAVAGERALDDQHARLAALTDTDRLLVSGPDTDEITACLRRLVSAESAPAAASPPPSGATEIADDILTLKGGVTRDAVE